MRAMYRLGIRLSSKVKAVKKTSSCRKRSVQNAWTVCAVLDVLGTFFGIFRPPLAFIAQTCILRVMMCTTTVQPQRALELTTSPQEMYNSSYHVCTINQCSEPAKESSPRQSQIPCAPGSHCCMRYKKQI